MLKQDFSELRREVCGVVAACAKEKEDRLAAWHSLERNALKEQAAALKQSEVLLSAQADALEAKIASMASKEVREGAPIPASLASMLSAAGNVIMKHAVHPLRGKDGASCTPQHKPRSGVHTGFNAIRSRSTPEGTALPLADLRVERNRLKSLVDRFRLEVAGAKSEITRAASSDARAQGERAIWETKLVALQDTIRVLCDEINLVEIEILGREQAERLDAARRRAEVTGTAHLHRARREALEARMRFNRAKRAIHFPALKGYNITFGGAGIYGATKDICIAEIRGAVSVQALAPGEAKKELEMGSSTRDEDGCKVHPAASSPDEPVARLIFEVSASKEPGEGKEPSAAATQARRTGPSPRGESQSERSGTDAGPSQSAPAALASAAPSPARAGRDAGTFPEGLRVRVDGRAEVSVGDRAMQSSPPRVPLAPSPPPQLSRLSPLRAGARPPLPAKRAGGAGEEGSAELACSTPPTPGQSSHPGGGSPFPGAHLAARAPSKGGSNMALNFMRRIGAKKDKYKDMARAPELSELGVTGEPKKKSMRSLASRLLGRRDKSRRGVALEEAVSETTSVQDGRTRDLSQTEDDVSVLLGQMGEGEGEDALPEEEEDLEEAEEDGEAEERQQVGGSQLQNGSSPPRFPAPPVPLAGSPLGPAPLTREALSSRDLGDRGALSGSGPLPSLAPAPDARRTSSGTSMGRGGWLRNAPSVAAGSSLDEEGEAGSLGALWAATARATPALKAPPGREGAYLRGRTSEFELVGEKGSKVPNLSIGCADVEAHVFVRFEFAFSKTGGWSSGGKPVFDVQHLSYSLRGNNVPMPTGLVRQILRAAIPGLIERRLLAVLPRELGEYLLAAQKGVKLSADVALRGIDLPVLDADLAYEVLGPSRSARDARRAARHYAASKEARALLGLSLPQAQLLGELFNGRLTLFPQRRELSIAGLVALAAEFEAHPSRLAALCAAISAGYALLARERELPALDFEAFLRGPVAEARRKPARAKVVARRLEGALNVDALLTAVHDFTQRVLEEVFVNPPAPNSSEAPARSPEALHEELEVLHAWNAWVHRELDHFKSRYAAGAATVLAAANARGFSAGLESAFYEGPLRLRLPLALRLDADGALSFDCPLPSPQGKLALFMDAFKALTVPPHLRPPAAALDWVALSDDPALNARMAGQVAAAIQAISDVLAHIEADAGAARAGRGPAAQEHPSTAMLHPRTSVGEVLGRVIVNRLLVRLRFNERRVAEILKGLDRASLGDDFVPTTGRILSHLGDIASLGLTPLPPAAVVGAPRETPPAGGTAQYLLHLESSDIALLRAEVESLGFQSAVSPGGLARLAHAGIRAAMLCFREGVEPAQLAALETKWRRIYGAVIKEGFDLSLCWAVEGRVEGGDFLVLFGGFMDPAVPRETSPLIATNDLGLVALGKAMRGDSPDD